ncbi:hypothetical protein AX15_000888 [Amanita polypyramis BW_CC]|nr:hypothetical protein AX15_000888 [Amanita polypyramis BW_CC]
MSRNLFCGSVRIVYAIIYTLFLGFGLTIGSDFYFLVDRHAHHIYGRSTSSSDFSYTHGHFLLSNGSGPVMSFSGVLGQTDVSYQGNNNNIIKGCYRDPSWGWLKQPLPTWTIFILVPLYSLSSSLANLQKWRSVQLPVMIFFSCVAYAANRATSLVLPGRTDIVSAAGAFVIGSLGNIYSRVVRGTAFTSMVTGVLFLVPSGIAQGGGVSQTYQTSAERYSNGFALALRMISVAAGVTVGLFVSQVVGSSIHHPESAHLLKKRTLVYYFGAPKNAGHFGF